MVKPVFRRKSIGTKVSEEEYARLEALARGRAMSEWVREVLLRELDGRQARPADETLLAETLALRTILLNLHFAVAKGEAITSEGMQAIIERADDGQGTKSHREAARETRQLKKTNRVPSARAAVKDVPPLTRLAALVL